MLHSTALCRGIAHAEEKIFWLFNSAKGSLDKYNFGADQGPGNDDHSDSEINRYAAGEVAGVPNRSKVGSKLLDDGDVIGSRDDGDRYS